MSLGSNIGNDIEALLSEAQPSAQAAAEAFAQAYFDYTSSAQFGASLPTILEAMRDAMAVTLAAGLVAPGLAATAAAAFSTAINTYWTGVSVAGGNGAGVTTGCPGAAALIAGMTTGLLLLENTIPVQAAMMTLQITTATLTTICTLTLPPGGPVPTPIS